MRINVNINNVNITLEGENHAEIMNIMNKIMNTPTPRNELLHQFKEATMPTPPEPIHPSSPSVVQFTPCSDKQKKLLRSIPEFKNRDLDTVSRKEAGEAIEAWNKRKGLSLFRSLLIKIQRLLSYDGSLFKIYIMKRRKLKMLRDEKMEKILQMNITPGQKIYLVTLYVYDEPMTTRDFNSYLNKKLTYENLEEAFEDLIKKGIIKKTVKISNGVKRNAFELNLEALKDEDECEDEE